MANRIVPYQVGMKVGLGFDRISATQLSGAVVGAVSEIPDAGGQIVTSFSLIAESVEELHKAVGISIDAGGAFLGISTDDKVNYINQFDFSSFSIYVIKQVSVRNAIKTIDSPVFSSDANELLIKGNSERFRERFGDAFIEGILTGGEYFAIYQLQSQEESERKSLAVQVQGGLNLIFASADVKADISTSISRSESDLKVTTFSYRSGGLLNTDQDLDDILMTAKGFPGAVATKGVAFSALLQEYNTLKLPIDSFNYLQIQQKQNDLEDLAKKRFDLLSLKDSIRYILTNIDSFQNDDGSAVNRDELTKILDEVIEDINNIQRAASKCLETGECNFSKIDPVKFVLPKPKLKPSSSVRDKVAGKLTINFTSLVTKAKQAAFKNCIRNDPTDPQERQTERIRDYSAMFVRPILEGVIKSCSDGNTSAVTDSVENSKKEWTSLGLNRIDIIFYMLQNIKSNVSDVLNDEEANIATFYLDYAISLASS